MNRTQHRVDPTPDYSPLLRAVQYLDECLKRGVAIGIYEGSMEVDDADIKKALTTVNNLLANTRLEMDKLARSIVRAQPAPGSAVLQ